jgi:hypothetical protein
MVVSSESVKGSSDSTLSDKMITNTITISITITITVSSKQFPTYSSYWRTDGRKIKFSSR